MITKQPLLLDGAANGQSNPQEVDRRPPLLPPVSGDRQHPEEHLDRVRLPVLPAAFTRIKTAQNGTHTLQFVGTPNAVENASFCVVVKQL